MISYVSIIALGFFLGMRHSTDPDHVIAIATIITRSRKVLESAAIGIVWAIGHTLTILVAGAGIILFNLIISPRAGLAVELTVGVMLIGLGLASLAGFRRWMPTTAAADPSSESDDGIIHSHFHSHGDYVHHHPQPVDDTDDERPRVTVEVQPFKRPGDRSERSDGPVGMKLGVVFRRWLFAIPAGQSRTSCYSAWEPSPA